MRAIVSMQRIAYNVARGNPEFTAVDRSAHARSIAIECIAIAMEGGVPDKALACRHFANSQALSNAKIFPIYAIECIDICMKKETPC